MAEFRNQAFVSYGDHQVAASNIVTGQLVNPLSITLHAGDHFYRTGEIIPFVITIRNRGEEAFTDMTVTDNLGGYILGEQTNDDNRLWVYPLKYVNHSLQLYVNGERQTVPEFQAATFLQVRRLAIPPFGSLDLMFQAQVTEHAPVGKPGDSFTSTAELNGNGLIERAASTETIFFDTAAFITLTKSVFPTEVQKDQLMTYTFTLYNYGAESNTQEQVKLTDNFTPYLNIHSVYVDKRKLEAGKDYTYSALGAFETKPGAIVVPAATFAHNPLTRSYTVTPGIVTVTVTGKI